MPRLFPLLALSIAGFVPCSFAQDAAPPGAAPPGAPTQPRTLRVTRFVPTAEKRMVSFVTAVFPDCSSRGAVVGRLVNEPEHGTITFEQGESFANFAPNSPFATCNSRKSKGLMVHYQSAASYVGEDNARILLIFPDGSAAEWEYTFVVK